MSPFFDEEPFFAYCQGAPREWALKNPVKPIPLFTISRGGPEIITAQRAAYRWHKDTPGKGGTVRLL
jgi:hypothetical protein